MDRFDATIAQASRHFNQQYDDLLDAESKLVDAAESNAYLLDENARLRKRLGER